MDEDLGLIYGLRQKFGEVRHYEINQGKMSHKYTFNKGVNENIPSGKKGIIDVDSMEETVQYTLDVANGNPMLRLSHSFEEIDRALSDGPGL